VYVFVLWPPLQTDQSLQLPMQSSTQVSDTSAPWEAIQSAPPFVALVVIAKVFVRCPSTQVDHAL
jgi:hypothetical protein